MSSSILTGAVLLALVPLAGTILCRKRATTGIIGSLQNCTDPMDRCCKSYENKLTACCFDEDLWRLQTRVNKTSSVLSVANGVVAAISIAAIFVTAIVVGIVYCCVRSYRASHRGRGGQTKPTQQPHVTMTSGSTNLAYNQGKGFAGQPQPMITDQQNPAYQQNPVYPQNPAYQQNTAYQHHMAYQQNTAYPQNPVYPVNPPLT